MENKLDPRVMPVGVIWPNTPICSGGHLSEGLARLALSVTVRMKCSAKLFSSGCVLLVMGAVVSSIFKWFAGGVVGWLKGLTDSRVQLLGIGRVSRTS